MRFSICSHLALMVVAGLLLQAQAAGAADSPDAKKPDEPPKPTHFKPEQQASKGSVTVGGQHIDYDAYAGTLVVHPKGWDDVPQNAPPDEDKNPPAEASMFYVAYFKTEGDKKSEADKGSHERPITFIYNGGPGSATVWLHMGAWGPKRVVTADDTHTPAAPYSMINNAYSLLDVSDLVFIDAPGAGFTRLAGKDKEKAFFGVDQDALRIREFHRPVPVDLRPLELAQVPVRRELRHHALGGADQRAGDGEFVDFNGVMLLSQILNYDNYADQPELNPGVDLPIN